MKKGTQLFLHSMELDRNTHCSITLASPGVWEVGLCWLETLHNFCLPFHEFLMLEVACWVKTVPDEKSG